MRTEQLVRETGWVPPLARKDIDDRSIRKGAFAGLAGGLAAAWVMNQFQAAASPLFFASQSSSGREDRSQPTSDERRSTQDSENDDATVRTASAISSVVLHRTLTPDEKKIAGPLVHYVVGAIMGATYGVMAEVAPAAAAGWGLPFGAAVWLEVDELANPALGLSKPVTEYPVSVHAYALASHLVYGFTTELVRRAIRCAPGRNRSNGRTVHEADLRQSLADELA